MDKTFSVGLISTGLNGALQVTNRRTVYDLYGPASFVGFSKVLGLSFGVDLISFSEFGDIGEKVDGIQISAGGPNPVFFDCHMGRTNTKRWRPGEPLFDQSSQLSSGMKVITNSKQILMEY